MNDPYVHSEAGEATEALGQRIDAVRELISQLSVSSVATDESAAQPPSPENFRLLCQRLRLLLEQSGMVDCALAALSLEQASEGLPSAQSLCSRCHLAWYQGQYRQNPCGYRYPSRCGRAGR